MLNTVAFRFLLLGMVMVLCVGCATTPKGQSVDFRDAAHPAWSLKGEDDGMKVAVSPARQTLQMAGSTGLLLGAGISALSNAKHRKSVRSALEGYDAGAAFGERIDAALQKNMNADLQRVAPLDLAAKPGRPLEVRRERAAMLSKAGVDWLLDTSIEFGLYGAASELAVRLACDLRRFPGAKKEWKKSILVDDAPILAHEHLKDPTDRVKPSFGSPKLKVNKDALRQWTEDHAGFIAQYESLCDGAVAAMLHGLGLEESAAGAFWLGRGAVYEKDWAEGKAYFDAAAALDPTHWDARASGAVCSARLGDMDGAIAATRALLEEAPEHGPAHFNLAWWQAMEKGDMAPARVHYDKAVSMGMPREKKLEKKLKI